MALSGKFISFEPIIESVYRRAGYQSIDWAEAVEVIGETIRLIGALPAYKDVTTNGEGTNPIPLEVVDFKASLPSDIISLKTIRKVELSEIDDGEGGTELVISGYIPMTETTDLYYRSTIEQWRSSLPSGVYDYVAFKQQDYIRLTGTSGEATITEAGGLTRTVTFTTDLATTAANFVTAYAADYDAQNIVISSSDGEDFIVFTSKVSGTPFTTPVITNTVDDLSGVVSEGSYPEPLLVIGPTYYRPIEYGYNYKVNNDSIYTNFKEGFLELVYLAFVTDDHGFPMIPDDQRYIEAIRWSLIEHLDYKKWRTGSISDKVYEKSEQNKYWYIGSAKSKSEIPTIDRMEAIKEMFLRTITKVRSHDTYFKYSNLPEMRFTHNRR